MRLITQSREIFICDLCGDNSSDYPEIEISHASFEHTFFGEEPSYGSGSDSEFELRKYVENGDYPYDAYDVVVNTAQESKIECCFNCFTGDTEVNDYMLAFDNALRQRRSEILLGFIKNKKILPGFTSEEDLSKNYLGELEEEERKFKEELLRLAKDNFNSDYCYNSCIESLFAVRNKIYEVRKTLL